MSAEVHHVGARLSVRSVSAMLLLAVMWGLSIPITKLGLQDAPPLTLTTMRFAVATPRLFLFMIGKASISRRALPRAAALGVLGIGVGQVTQALSIAGTTASVGTIISATIPIFVVIFAARRLGQRATGRQQLGLSAAPVTASVQYLQPVFGGDGLRPGRIGAVRMLGRRMAAERVGEPVVDHGSGEWPQRRQPPARRLSARRA